MSQYIVKSEDITSIADAMREMSGTDQKYTFPQDFSDYIYTSKKLDGKDLAIALLNDELSVIYSTYFGTLKYFTGGLGNSKNIRIVIFPEDLAVNDGPGALQSLPASTKYIRFGKPVQYLSNYIAGDGTILDFTLSERCILTQTSSNVVVSKSNLTAAKYIIVRDDKYDDWVNNNDFLPYVDKIIKTSQFNFEPFRIYMSPPTELDIDCISRVLSNGQLEFTSYDLDGIKYSHNTLSASLATDVIPRQLRVQDAYIPPLFISEHVIANDNTQFGYQSGLTLEPFAFYGPSQQLYASSHCILMEAGVGSLCRQISDFQWRLSSYIKMDFTSFIPDVSTVSDFLGHNYTSSDIKIVAAHIPQSCYVLPGNRLLFASSSDKVDGVYTVDGRIKEILTHAMCLLSNCTIVFGNTITQIPNYVFGKLDSVAVAPSDLKATNIIPDVGENVTSIGEIFIPSDTKKAIFRQPKDVVVQLPEKLCYSKTAATIDVYTDNDSIKNYDWAKDNFTPTFHSLSELETT